MTIEEIKTLESLFIVEMHSAERIFRLIETGMETIYRESKDYKALVKRHGKPAADQIVRHYTHQVLTQDEQYNIGQLLKVCKTLAYRHALMCCIDPSDDIKVDSTLKALAKDPTVSARIIERLKV